MKGKMKAEENETKRKKLQKGLKGPVHPFLY